MGYYVDMVMNDVRIKKKDVKKALKAINDMNTEETLVANGGGSTSQGGKIISRSFSWVNYPESGKFNNIVEALAEWRYESHIDRNGNLVVDYFDGEKLGDDEFFWTTLAPFVEGGADIEFDGEDNYKWKYVFHDGGMNELQGKVIWE